MSLPVDSQGILGLIISNLTEAVTGNMFLTLFFLFALFTLILMSFGLPNEVIYLVMMPALIVLMAFTGDFILMGVIIFFVLASIFARSFFLT